MRLLSSVAVALVLALAGCGGEDAATPAGAIEIRLSDFALDPDRVSVDEPGTYVLRAVNEGESAHALELEGHGVEAETGELEPGESAELTVELPEAGEYELSCPVGEHREHGMVGSVVVGGEGGASGEGGATTATGPDGTTGPEDEYGGGGYGKGG